MRRVPAKIKLKFSEKKNKVGRERESDMAPRFAHLSLST